MTRIIPSSGRRWRSWRIFFLISCVLSVTVAAGLYPVSAVAQRQGSNALALQIIDNWRQARSAPTPETRIALIEKALALAVPADPWPFRSPPRAPFLAQMWGQLGNEYRRVDGPERSDALERAVKAYHAALELLRTERSANWARAQFGLGAALLDRVRGDRADNIERAVAALISAASVMTRERAPSHWAGIQVLLSKAYWHRLAGAKTENLERAIEYARAALAVVSREREPGDWRSAQQALGAAYWARIKGSRADNVEKAIGAYEQAIALVVRKRAPTVWAGLHDNLGMAYGTRVRGQGVDNVNLAAEHFRQAAEVYTRQAYPFDWAQLNLNLGSLYLDRELGSSKERIERAIGLFRKALSVYTPDAFPERSARVQINLGIAYSKRWQGDEADNIEAEIAAYRAALTYYSRDNEPTKWAIVQNNLGVALRRRIAGRRDANLALAAAAHEAALSVQTPEAAPLMHLRAAYLAGEVAADRGDWTKAARYFDRAIATSSLLFGGGLNRADAEAITREGPQLFAGAAFAAVKRNAPVEALELIERGRARVLRVALGLEAIKVAPAERRRLDEIRAQIRRLERELEAGGAADRVASVRRLERLRRSARQIISKASGASDDVSNKSAIEIAAGLLKRYRAIVIPIVTDQGGALIIVRTGRDAKPTVEATEIATLDGAAVRAFLYGGQAHRQGWFAKFRAFFLPERGQSPGWLQAYGINHLALAEKLRRQGEWRAAIAALEKDLGRLFGVALATTLRGRGIAAGAEILWLPQGALGLVPAGLAEGRPGRPLIEDYVLVTAPSLTAAAVATQRAQHAIAPATMGRPNLGPSLAAIVNPTGDLASTEPEGAVAASYFQSSKRTVLTQGKAGLAAVTTALAHASHWHFATHGTFSWRTPRLSALLLAANERLTIGDLLDRTDLGHPRLVVLSACETGIFDYQRAPDEFVGLPTAFLEAGAAGIVGTLWEVDDLSTALIMMQFYELYLGEHKPPPAALRAAQRWLRQGTSEDFTAFIKSAEAQGRLTRSQADRIRASIGEAKAGSRPFAHPYYWGPFVYYGS
jgi:CHAT domain-containing protein/tetratricopeptide (TPR) repeat protein